MGLLGGGTKLSCWSLFTDMLLVSHAKSPQLACESEGNDDRGPGRDSVSQATRDGGQALHTLLAVWPSALPPVPQSRATTGFSLRQNNRRHSTWILWLLPGVMPRENLGDLNRQCGIHAWFSGLISTRWLFFSSKELKEKPFPAASCFTHYLTVSQLEVRHRHDKLCIGQF